MLVARPIMFRKRRPTARAASEQTPPVGPLALVAAEYQPSQWVRLTFDRAIDIAGLDATQVLVNDGTDTGSAWQGTGGGTLVSPTTVEIQVVEIGDSATPDVRLTATDETGIVAVGDGAAWAGVTDLELPVP